MDVRAFGEQPLFDDAIHLRADFGHAPRVRAARQHRFQRDGLHGQRHDTHFRHRRRGFLLPVASGKCKRTGDGARKQQRTHHHCCLAR